MKTNTFVVARRGSAGSLRFRAGLREQMSGRFPFVLSEPHVANFVRVENPTLFVSIRVTAVKNTAETNGHKSFRRLTTFEHK